jgi:hypothetical protein
MIFHFLYGLSSGSSGTHWRTHIFQDGYCTTNQSCSHLIQTPSIATGSLPAWAAMHRPHNRQGTQGSHWIRMDVEVYTYKTYKTYIYMYNNYIILYYIIYISSYIQIYLIYIYNIYMYNDMWILYLHIHKYPQYIYIWLFMICCTPLLGCLLPKIAWVMPPKLGLWLHTLNLQWRWGHSYMWMIKVMIYINVLDLYSTQFGW